MAAPASNLPTGQYIGISNLHVAKLLTDPAGGTATYEDPIDFGKVLRQVQIEPTTNDAKLYADNQVIAMATVTQEFSLEFETSKLPLAYQAYLLGHTYENGVMTINKDDVAPYFAVMFQDDLDDGKRFFVKFFKVQFQEPSTTNRTKEDNIEYVTPTMSATAIQRLSDGNSCKYADEGASDFAAATAASWYTAVDPSTGS